MAYKKIYYDDIWEITSKSTIKCTNWLESIGKVYDCDNEFIDNTQFTGSAANGIKDYLNEVHGVLNTIMITALQAFITKAKSYYAGYESSVDAGDGSEYGLRYTTLVYSEIDNQVGSIKNEIKRIIQIMEQVASDANGVKNSIAHLARISAYPHITNLYDALNNAVKKATDVHKKAINFEKSRAHDFDEIDRLIAQAQRIINQQIGKKRTAALEYQSGSIGNFCDVKQVFTDLQATQKYIKTFEESDLNDRANELAYNRDAFIQAEAESNREWVKWIAVGVAVVGGVVLTIATVGGASVGACALVGAAVGAATATTTHLTNNYIKSGNVLYNEDGKLILADKEFWQDLIVGTTVGAVGGALGAVSQGSAIQQPVQKALFSAAKSGIQEGTRGLVSTAVDTTWDVGEALLSGKPGDEIICIASEDITSGLQDTLKGMTVEGAKSFAAGYVGAKFDLNTGDKSYLRKVGESAAESIVSNVAGGAVKTGWDVGEALLDPNSSKTVTSVLKDNAKETVQNIAGDTIKSAISESVPSLSKIKNKVAKVVLESTKDTVADTAESVTKGVTGRTIDYVIGYEKDGSKIYSEIWEEDLDEGRNIAESGLKNLGDNAVNEAYKDKKYYVELNKLDHNKDGKIEVVQFGDYAVTKDDYDAAVKNAHTGVYKDKSAQDLLGLPKDTDLNSGKHRTVSIDMTEEYSSNRKTVDTVTIDGKYTYRKEYYDSAVNVAGKGEYKGKTVQEVLGIPKDTKISEENLSYKRVNENDIGFGKNKVELTNDSFTNAKKIHISSMNHDTKLTREKAKEQASEYNKEHKGASKSYKDFYKKNK